MRTVQDLLDDLGRVDGRLFDETVFEIFHRGPKALDRLFSYWENHADADLRRRIRASVVRQWTRIQETLIQIPPRLMGSSGVKLGLELGPADSLARRAQRCIEQGMTETAVCIASALAASGRVGVDHAVLEARLALAMGRPEEAIRRLGAHGRPGPCGREPLEWMAAALIAAGRPGDAFLVMLKLEPDPASVAKVARSLIVSGDVDGLERCITEIARAGDVGGWRLLASGLSDAATQLAEDDAELIGRLFGAGDDIRAHLDVMGGVLDDLATAPSEAAVMSMVRELRDLAAETLTAVDRAQRLVGAAAGDEIGAEELAAIAREVVGDVSACDDGGLRWSCHVDSSGHAAAAGAPACDADPRLLHMIAMARGSRASSAWSQGQFRVEISPRDDTYDFDASYGFDADDAERVLKSSPPHESAHRAITGARTAVLAATRPLLGAARKLLREIHERLSDAILSASGNSEGVLVELRTWRDMILRVLQQWPEACEISDEGAAVRAALERAIHGGQDADDPAHTGGDEASESGWRPPEGVRCSADAEQALRTAHLLLEAAEQGPLPPEQALLPVFLLDKAVEIEIGRQYGELVAAHRLRPTVLRATRDKGKRRRELSPEFVRGALAVAPDDVSADKVQGGLERLASRVLDGGSKPISTEVLLVGLALMCLDVPDAPAGSVPVGRALVSFGAKCDAAIKDPASADMRSIEQLAHEALRRMVG